jgi:hypothetical protein
MLIAVCKFASELAELIYEHRQVSRHSMHIILQHHPVEPQLALGHPPVLTAGVEEYLLLKI